MRPHSLRLLTILLAVCIPLWSANLEFAGSHGPGKGKRVVLIAGDDEYHSEEMLPQLAKILAFEHGFDCTVLFSIDPKTGTMDPHEQRNIPGIEALDNADLLILFTRFRDLPDDQMKHFVDYTNSGRPIIGIRTATHAFEMKSSKTYAEYSWNSTVPGWEGGFGRRILGETWIAHHGHHGKQSTKALVVPAEANNPILQGIWSGAIWVPTDVYEVRLPLPSSCTPLLLGEVLSGMQPDSPPVTGKQNDPMLPVAWTNSYTGSSGKPSRIFATTMGSAEDLKNESYRRLLVNAAYWTAGLEKQISSSSKVDLVGTYQPRSFLDETYMHGVKPQDLKDDNVRK